MKFTVTFKTPDALQQAMKAETSNDACGADECGEDGNPGMCVDCEYRSDVNRETADEMYAIGQKFIRCGEYIVVEFDTDADTCVVVPVKK